MDMAEGFQDCLAWQKAHELMLLIHREVVPRLPPEEKWDLAIQIRKSSKSVGSNFAEGYGRYYYPDRIRFCHMARGSLTETQNHLIASRDLGYVSEPTFHRAIDLSTHVHRLLNGYIDYLKRQQPGKEEPGLRLGSRRAPNS